jgi:hypothetical protein
MELTPTDNSRQRKMLKAMRFGTWLAKKSGIIQLGNYCSSREQTQA